MYVAYKVLINTHFMFICQIPMPRTNNYVARNEEGFVEVCGWTALWLYCSECPSAMHTRRTMGHLPAYAFAELHSS